MSQTVKTLAQRVGLVKPRIWSCHPPYPHGEDIGPARGSGEGLCCRSARPHSQTYPSSPHRRQTAAHRVVLLHSLNGAEGIDLAAHRGLLWSPAIIRGVKANPSVNTKRRTDKHSTS